MRNRVAGKSRGIFTKCNLRMPMMLRLGIVTEARWDGR